MLPVTGVVAHLGTDRGDVSMQSHFLRVGHRWGHRMTPYHTNRLRNVNRDGILRRPAARHHAHVWCGLPCKYPLGSSQTASTYGWRYKSPSSPPLCPHSSGSGSWCRRSSPNGMKKKGWRSARLHYTKPLSPHKLLCMFNLCLLCLVYHVSEV